MRHGDNYRNGKGEQLGARDADELWIPEKSSTATGAIRGQEVETLPAGTGDFQCQRGVDCIQLCLLETKNPGLGVRGKLTDCGATRGVVETAHVPTHDRADGVIHGKQQLTQKKMAANWN